MVLHNLCYPIGELLVLLEYHDKYSTPLKYINFVLSVVTCIIGIAGNAIVICYNGFIMKKRKSKIWFLNLAIADLVSILLLPLQAIAFLKGNWPFGLEMCKVFLFSICANMYASILIMISLNITRVLSVTQPMFHHKFITQRVSCWTCTLIWIITVLSTLPVLFFSGEVKVGENLKCLLLGVKNVNSGHITAGHNMSEENIRDRFPFELYKFHPYFKQCSADKCCGDEETLKHWNNVIFSTECFVIPLLLIGYFIPLCVVIISNITIVVQVKKSQTANTHRLNRIVVVIIMAYFITWTPLIVAEIVFLNAARNMDLAMMFKLFTFIPILVVIAYTNCCLNPILYVLVNRRIRTGLTDFISSIRSSLKPN